MSIGLAVAGREQCVAVSRPVAAADFVGLSPTPLVRYAGLMSGPPPTEPSSPPPDASRLHAPLGRVLRPLVRLMIRSGVTFPALVDLLRELYVNVAEYDFALPGKEQTDSRVSLLTGIHRKEVRRLRGAGAPVQTVPTSLSRTSRIIARWLAEPGYIDAAGHPLPLPRTAPEGQPSFDALVSAVTRDVRPRAVLDEWLDSKIVVLDDEERIVLTEAAFIPRGDDDRKLHYFSRNLHDHAEAAVSNILSPQPRFMERSVHYDRLSAPLARDLAARSRALAMEALQAANREAHAACQTDPGGGSRWNFGVYVYVEDGEAAPPPEPGHREVEP